jgi:hypothetical protein
VIGSMTRKTLFARETMVKATRREFGHFFDHDASAPSNESAVQRPFSAGHRYAPTSDSVGFGGLESIK